MLTHYRFLLNQLPTNQKKGSLLSGRTRFYLEECVPLKEKSYIRVLLPSDHVVFESYQPVHETQTPSSKLSALDCTIEESPNYNWVKKSLAYAGTKHSLTRGNCGSCAQVNDDHNHAQLGESTLLTWIEVLLGKLTGVQA